jgi:hypothetical protein
MTFPEFSKDRCLAACPNNPHSAWSTHARASRPGGLTTCQRLLLGNMKIDAPARWLRPRPGLLSDPLQNRIKDDAKDIT